jgi:serralysin
MSRGISALRSQSFLASDGQIAFLGADVFERFGLGVNSSVENGWLGNVSFLDNSSVFSVDGLKDLVGHQGGCSCGECLGGGKTFQPGGDDVLAPNFAPDVVPGDTSSTVDLTLGSFTAGEIDTLGDHDWYRITLTAGQTYTFSIDPSGPGGAVTDVEDSYLRLRNSAGTLVAENDDGGLQTHSNLTFTATTTGTYFVDVGTYNDGETGTFRVLAVNAGTGGADSVAAFSGTTGVIALGGTVNSTINTVGDQDWFAITLTAGQRYQFRTQATGGGGDVDTALFVRNAAGDKLASNDDSGGGGYSSLIYTPSTTGTYYINVAAFANASSGNYRLTADVAPPLQLYTTDQIADQLINGYWGGSANARRFNVTTGGSVSFNVQALTADGQFLARQALLLWTDATGITFNEVTTGGQLTFDDNQSGAFASSTRSGNFIIGSQINVSTNWLTTYGTGLNTYSFQTYIHEIGHAIGLGHAGNYNGSADYNADALYLNDAWATTVMSYFDQGDNTYFNGLGFTTQFVVSPIIADVLATNTMYGTPTTTRTGNTTYGFNNNSGRDIYNAALYPSVTYTIVDSGGTDTMDYSGFSQTQRIDLNAEAFSNIGGRTGNVTIARGTVIENAIGGSGADTIIGNAASNVLNGGGGINTLSGNAGNDTLVVAAGSAGSFLDGGANVDTLFVVGAVSSLGGFAGFERILFDITSALTLTGAQVSSGLSSTATIEGTGVLTVNMTTSGDFISKLFTFVGAGVSVTVNGTTGNDIFKLGNGRHTINAGDGLDQVKGGSAIDTINGGTGVDKINGAGGADILTGGTGADVFKYAAASDSGTGVNADQITDYEIGIDKLNFGRIDANAGIGGDQAFNFVGTGAFSGGGAGSIRYQNSGGNLLVQVDVDGNGTADMEIILAGRAGGTLTTADFVL